MSITFQYLRMFAPNRTVNPFVYYGSWLIVIICTLFYTITTLLTIFACAPREKIWNKLYVGGHCLTYRAIILSTAIFNIISDVAILLLPVRTVWKLRIPTQKKVAISLLFGTGLL
jgi:archaellum biogenesis protein FlaJ (TadC family)